MLACLLLLSAPASASVPYDKFCDQDGKVTDDREVLAMLARPGELDAIYEDALRGDVRATRFLRTLEVTFEESARVVAENVSSPECAVAPFLPKCRADWRILAPLRGQGRGAARLLEVTQDAYEQRLRELAPQRRLNEAALTMLMTVGPLRAKGPAAKSAGAAETRPTAPAAPAAQKGAGAADDVFHVTPDGVALPKGPKHKIPEGYVENPHRSGSYGEIVNGKFKERLRIDPPTPPGQRGPNTSHYHLDGKGKHHSPAPGDKDPGFQP